MGNACGGSLRSKYLHSFKHAASKRHTDDPDYDTHAAVVADSPKKPPPSATAKTDPHAAPAPPPRRGGAAGAPVDLGSVLGHPTPNLRDLYALGRKLGQGQFGTTHLATDLVTGAEYACKSISKRKLITKEDIDDVRREIQIMHHLSGHQNVVAIKGAYEDQLYVHIVMELCAGGELFDRIIQRGHYSERKAAELTRIIVGVVEACHSLGVMHRDLKPENFLLANKDDDLSLKAIDFGLSVFFKPGQVFTDVVGSPYYVAPEVLCKKYGPEADVWTAGVILYILLSGVPPFWAETQQGIFDAVLKGVIDFDSEPWPLISDSAKDLITKMLNPRREERLSAHQVLCHPWIRDQGVAPDRPLDTAVLSRIKQFSAMNKLKKMALRGMDLGRQADNMLGTNDSGKQAVWTTAMSSFVLKFMANLVAGGTKTCNSFKQVHHESCAKALNERFRVHLTATQVSNHLRKWKRIWVKVTKLKNLSGALWDEHTCTIVLDQEHYTAHVKDHLSDADLLNTPIEHYHEMATICGNGMVSDVSENETENEKSNGVSGPLATDVTENANNSEEAAKCFTDTGGGSFGEPPGSLPPPKKAKGMHLEQHVDNMGGNSGGVVVWTNAMSSFVLQFLANLVAGGTRPSQVFKQVHLKSCARALSDHFRVQVNAAQISNHLRKWKKIWAKVNILKSLSGALWDENTCTIVLDLEHYAAYVKDHYHDADFLNTPIKHYREMATIFVKGMTSSRPAKSSSGPLAREVTEKGIENENMDGECDLIAKFVGEAAVSFSDSDEGNVGDSSGSLPPPPKKAKVKSDESMLCRMTGILDRLAEAVEKCSRKDTDVPEGLWANMKDLPGFEQEHLAHYYAYLCENPAIARAFYNLSMSPKMVWVTRYIKNHLSA